MTSRLAALVASVFAAAVIAPPDGVVVHHHAGGDHAHVHPDLTPQPRHHPHADADADHRHGHDDHAGANPQHEHADDDHHHGPDGPAAAPHHGDAHAAGLTAGSEGGGDHVHTLPDFVRALSPAPRAPAPPQPLARLVRAQPPARIAPARPTTRSRGPPVRSI